MSARAELMNELTMSIDDDAATELLDAYAHELAEQQRAATPFYPCSCGMDYCGSCDTYKLIDLIDPEVKT